MIIYTKNFMSTKKIYKICAITTISSTLEEFVIPALRLFVQDGHDVTIMCTMDQTFIDRYSNEFNCINIKMKRGFSIKDLFVKPFEFYRIFKSEKFDYVQYGTNNASCYASIGAWMARIPNRVNCLWGIGFHSKKGYKRFCYKMMEKFPCLLSTHISIPSRKNQKLGAEAGLFKLKHSSVVGDGGTVGVDLKKFDYALRENYREAVLNEYPQLRGKFVYGYLGRIYKDKGINELLEAFMSINDNELRLFLIGGIDELRSGISTNLLKRARENKNIIFHGYTKEVSKYLSVIDVLVHPTYHEGFSMAIQQAMAMGCAIVTTNVPGPSEVIEEGVSGLLVPPENSYELRKAMEKIYTNDSLRESFVNDGLKRVRSLFSRERMVQATFDNRMDILNGKY